MGLFDCVGGKQTGTKWAKESQRPKERPRGTSPGFTRSTSRMSRSSLFASNVSLGKVKNMDIDHWRTRVLNYLYHGEGKEDIRFLGVPLRQLGFESVTDFIVAIPPELYEEYTTIKPDEGLMKDDKVIWQRDGIAEPGVFKWSGVIADQQVMGLQLDRKKVVPFGIHDGKGLFYCKPGHRAMVPEDEVIPYRKFLRGFVGIIPRKQSMTLDLNGASSSKGNPAKQRDKKWKQGDHVYLNQEKKWATIQWTGRIGSDTVVDIVYDKDKPADKRVVSPDEPPISRSLSLAEFINEVGKEDEKGTGTSSNVQKPKEGKLAVPPPPPEIKAPSDLDDEVFDDDSHLNETTDDSALDETEDDSDTDSDDSDDTATSQEEASQESQDEDSQEEDEDKEPMTPPPQRPATPPAKKTSLENIVLYDDNLRKMSHQRSPKESRKNETISNENEKIETIKDDAQIQGEEKRSKSLLSFGFKKNKHAQKEQSKTEEIMKVSSLPRLENKEKPKQRRFFRRRGSTDGEDFSRDSFKKNRESTMSESGIKVEVEQHLPPKEKSQSVNYIDNNEFTRRLSSDDSSDYYRPSSPGIKDTGIQMSNAMLKFKEKSKKNKEKDTTKSPRGSLSSFFFPKKNKSASKEERLDQLTATEIDIEAESPVIPKSPTTKNSSDLVLLPDETLTVETEVVEDHHSSEELVDQEKENITVPVEEKPQRKGKSLISSFFSKKSNKNANEDGTAGKSEDDAQTSTTRKASLEQQDLVVENPVSDAENKNSEKLRNSEESLEEDSRIGRASKIRSSFNFFSRKKKSIPEPVEKDFPGANDSADLIEDSVFRNSIESHENPPVMDEPPVVKMRKPKESVVSEQERRPSSDSQDKKSDKEKRSSFRDSFVRRFSLPRRKSSSTEKKDKSKNSLEKKEEPIKSRRPKSLFSRSQSDDETEQLELNRAKSASVLVDIQPWDKRRAPKVEVVSSFASPVDSSGKNEDISNISISHLPVTPKKSDTDVPKHRMYTTPVRRGSKRSRKSTDDDYDSKEYDQENEGPISNQIVKNDVVNQPPSVTSNSTIFTSVSPILAAKNSVIDVTSPVPTAVISEPVPSVTSVSSTLVISKPLISHSKPVITKRSESTLPQATEEVLPVRRTSVRKSSPPASALAPPLQRIASIPKSKPNPLIRLATPVGYGVQRTAPSGTSLPPVPTFNAKTIPSAIWIPKSASGTKPSINAMSVLKSLPADTEATKAPPSVDTPTSPKTALPELPMSPPPIPPKTPSHTLPQSQAGVLPPRPTTVPRSPPPTLPKSSPRELPKSPPPELPKSSPLELPKSPPPESPKSSPLELPKSPPPELPKSSPLELPKSPPPELPKSSPLELPKSPPPELPKSPPPELPKSPPPTLLKFPLPILPQSPPPTLPSSPPPVLPKNPPPMIPNSPAPSFAPITNTPSSPPPIMVTSSIAHLQKPLKPIISDLPLIHTVTGRPSTERFSTTSEEMSPVEKVSPVYYKEPSPASPVKVKVAETEPVNSMPFQSVPIGVTAPLRQSSPEKEEKRVPQTPTLHSSVNLARTPSLDKPPPLPTAPPPNRFGNPPVCVTPPTPKAAEVVPVEYATPNPPLKSAFKQRKEIECIPRGLKIYDRVLWYNGSSRVPGTVLRLYKDGIDKYTAVVKFDRESLQSPLTLTREGDAYEVTVEELLPTEVFADEMEVNENQPPPLELNSNVGRVISNVIVDKDSDDGLRKNSLKGPSVQFRNPSVEGAQAVVEGIQSESESVSDDGDGTMPPPFVEEEINIACGMRRGIHSTENSSCLETLLFSMFYTTSSFDIYLLFENPYEDQPTTKEIKAILREEIVKPMRETGYVGIDAMRHLQETMLPLSTDLNSLSSKAEVMMFILFQRALNLREFITYSSDIFDYHHQILLNHKDPSKCVTTQYLFENSLQLMDNFKLKTIPTPALILEMPRTNNKMVQYDAVVPNLTLNIGHLLENGPKICLCGMVAKFECRFCVEQTQGTTSIVYCDSCRGMSDQIHHQLGHNPTLSPINQINGLMDLVAVICVSKGHYVSYVKCGIERLSPWLYYDATVDEAPRVSVEQHLGMWLDRLEKYPGKYRDAFAHSLLAQLLTDNHICIYQSRQKGSYV